MGGELNGDDSGPGHLRRESLVRIVWSGAGEVQSIVRSKLN